MRPDFQRLLLLTSVLMLLLGIPAIAQQKCANDDYDCKIELQTNNIQANPNDPEAYYNRAMAYKNKNQFAKAKADLDKYVSMPNNNVEYLADGYAERGWTKYKMNDVPGAMADYDKALATNAKNSPAYFRKGMIYSDQEKWQMAIDNYDQALKYDPNEYEVYYNRGRAYRVMGSYDKAISEYTTYIGLNSAKLEYAADGYRGRGMTYNLTGKYDLAVSDLTKAIQLVPNNSVSYSERAKAYRKLGKTELAAADEAKAKQLGG